ncbi:MAG: YitT family protein [Ignavibacteria bacterium]|nr:YitT family protein [Ignavibacteria bacterium]
MSKQIRSQKKSYKVFYLIRDLILISAGIFSAALGLKGFLLPNGFIDGGVTGISLLVTQLTGIPLSILLILINAPFIIMGYFQISKMFALKAALAIAGLAMCLAVISFPVVTSDKLLVAAFGGFCLGTGIGLAIRGGCVIDGTEILALYISRKTSLKVGDVVLLINVIIFSVAAIVLGIEKALYSVLSYFAASKAVDFIIEGIEEYTGVTIISEKSHEIRKTIIEKMGRGFTIYTGKKGYGKRGEVEGEIDIIYTVITRLEISKLKNIVNIIDENAFVVMQSINDTKGGMIKRRALH